MGYLGPLGGWGGGVDGGVLLLTDRVLSRFYGWYFVDFSC